MKILILANSDIGLYQFRKELIKELLKENNVVISCPDGDLVKPLQDMGCIFVDTPIDRRGVNPKTDLKLYFTYRKILKKECPDLVITYTIKPDVYGGYACKRLKIPYAENITGLGTAFQKEGLLRKLVIKMYQTGLKKAKVVFFENEENRQVFIREKIVKEAQTCLLSGAGVNLNHYAVQEYPGGKTVKFLFMGRVMKEKGIDELFQAMKLLIADGIDCSLDVLGGYEEDYRDVIRIYENEGWMKYHGYKKDVRPYIKKCHCFVLPSWHEGMANTNLECAAMGRPVITSNIFGCKEAVEDGVSGYYCEKQNVQKLYQVMKKFTKLSYEDRKKMGLAGRKRMEEIFDKKKIVQQTIKYIFEK